MMAAVTAKYINRDEGILVNMWLRQLHRLGDEVEGRVNDDPKRYESGLTIPLQPTRKDQLALLRQQCERILALMPDVVALGGYIPSEAMNTLEILLGIVKANVEAGG
jgi:hypothetical protein